MSSSHASCCLPSVAGLNRVNRLAVKRSKIKPLGVKIENIHR